jgi:hypothetical protein
LSINIMASTSIQVSGLAKTKIAALRKQAKSLGMSAERYAKRLIEQGISLERQARTKSFDELFAPAQARFRASGMSEEGLDQLVGKARQRLRRNSHSKRKN